MPTFRIFRVHSRPSCQRAAKSMKKEDMKMPEQRSRPRDGRVIALANQKGGTGKTTTTVNLGIGLARLGKKVLLIDADPQGDLTTCLGWQDQDSLQTTLATVMGKIIRDEPFTADEGILHHSEGVDLMPANIELSDLEATLVNAMSREITLRTYVNEAKKNYDVVLIDCMPSLGMITINALAAAEHGADILDCGLLGMAAAPAICPPSWRWP